MKLCSIVGATLLAQTCLGSAVGRRLPREGRVHGNPLNLANSQGGTDSADKPDGANVLYSSNWAGAALQGGGYYVSVTGDVTLGRATTPTGGSTRTEYATTSWVGIGGITCGTEALLQVGVDTYVEGGEMEYSPWYEWYPLPSTAFSNFAVKMGDTIRMNVTAYSATSGIAILENLSTNTYVYHTFTNQASLCFESAEWIVEDFSSGGSLVSFANFTTVTFNSASAVTSTGTRYGTTDAEIFDIRQSSRVLTDCAVASSSSVYCTYV